MALRNIYVEGDPILRKKCRPVEKFDEKLSALLDDMHETLDRADGVGLAAPQVGICRRVFVIHLEDLRIEAVNPEISGTAGKQRVKEGCLSCPDVWGYVTRPKKLTLKAVNRHGEPFEMVLDGIKAQCVSHENAHLEGQLFVDIVEEFIDPEEEAKPQKRVAGKKFKS
ncbi:MAG: peptide deformylase [Ruminococcus sp.]|nr:peptide deformylase [Ruminococcus sp.]